MRANECVGWICVIMVVSAIAALGSVVFGLTAHTLTFGWLAALTIVLSIIIWAAVHYCKNQI